MEYRYHHGYDCIQEADYSPFVHQIHYDASIENGISSLSPNPGQLILKVLIPGYAAGAVIGKGGQIIVQLQKDSGAIIKLSKAKDFYPGTQDRVVLIQGNAEGLMKVQNTIIEKVYEFPVPKDLAAIIGDRPKQVKMIVPNTTAGLVIGKAGATVKTIMEESGSKVQLSQKPEGVNVQERVITIKGEKHQLIAASNIIIDKIKDDPQSASCPNISYSGIAGPVANANPTGSPYAAGSAALVDASHPAVAAMLGHYIIPNQHPTVLQAAVPTYTHHATAAAAGYPAVTGANGELATLNTAALGYTVGGFNYSPFSVVPGVHAAGAGTSSLGVIPNASLAGSVSPLPSSNPLLSAATLPTESTLHAGFSAAALPAQTFSLQNNNYLASLASAGYFTANHPQLFSATSAVPGAANSLTPHPPAAVTPTSLSLPSTPPSAVQTVSPHSGVTLLSVEKTTDGQRETVELAIPENLIGAILGKAGRTLVEYQDISGAKIQISKKGEYVIGTRNRKVSITGKPPSTQTAQLLITQRIAAAQTARSQQVKFM